MDAESQHLEDLKARITELETALSVWRILGEEFKRRDDDAMAAIQRLEKAIEEKNQIIRELCAWLDSEFRFDTWPPESPGRQLWDRAQATIDVT